MSNRSSSKLFATGFAENLRRFWPVALASFLVLFFSGPYVGIIDEYGRDSSQWITMLNNLNFGFVAVHLIIPIAAAVCVFKYLHAAGSVAVMNALPFSRGRLFRVNFFAGVALWLAPLLLNAFILALLATGEGFGLRVLNWLLVSFVMEAAVYAFSVFSCCVTGTVIHSFLGAFFFNGIVPVVAVILVAMESAFIWGAKNTSVVFEWIAEFHPVSAALYNSGWFVPGYYLYAFLLIAAVSTVSFFLYKNRKMERAGDALAYKSFEPVMSVLIAFIGMSAVALLFMIIRNDTRSDFLTGCLIGFPIAWIAGRMLVMKTVRIFGKKDLVNLGVSLLVCATVVSGFAFDLFRLEERIPSASSVKSVEFDVLTYNAVYEDSWTMYNRAYSEPETVQAAIDFHKEILANKSALKTTGNRYGYYDGEDYRSVGISYRKTGLDLGRSYTLPVSFINRSAAVRTFFESAEYKDAYRIANQEASFLRNASENAGLIRDSVSAVSLLNERADSVVFTRAADISRLVDALDRDWKNLSFEDSVAGREPLCRIVFQYTVYEPKDGSVSVGTLPSPQNSDKYYTYSRTITANVLPTSTNTIAVLKSLGAWDSVVLSSANVEGAYVFHYDQAAANAYWLNATYYDDYEKYFGISQEDYNQMSPEERADLIARYGQDLQIVYESALSSAKICPVDEEIAYLDASLDADARSIDSLIAHGKTGPENYADYYYVLLAYKPSYAVAGKEDDVRSYLLFHIDKADVLKK